MKKQELYEKGLKLIDDARFVFVSFIPVAFSIEKWNIVVFEAYRASELLVKGIINACGYEHEETHELHKLVNKLSEILDENKERIAFIYEAVDNNKNAYFVSFADSQISLIKRTNDIYTFLGTVFNSNPYVPAKIIRRGWMVNIQQGKKVILGTTDSSLATDLTHEKKIPHPPDRERVGQLQNLTRTLLETREQAFYREKEFTANDANEAYERVKTVFALSKAFTIADRI